MTPELPYAEELRRCVDENDADLLSGVKVIARILNPDVDSQWVDAKLSNLAEEIRARGTNIENLLNVFIHHGFRGVAENEFHEYRNSDISYVLAEKKGIPITNSAMIMAVCDRLSLLNHGINFPGMFLTQVDEDLVDPVNYAVLDYSVFKNQMRRRNIEAPEEPAIASNRDILARMFNNLEAIAVLKGDVVRSMEFIDYMACVSPDYWYPHFERAKVWSMMGDVNSAKTELEIARTLVDDEEIVRAIDRQLKQLRLMRRDDVLN